MDGGYRGENVVNSQDRSCVIVFLVVNSGECSQFRNDGICVIQV